MEQEKEPIKMQDYKGTKEGDSSPTMEEVELAVQKLRIHKSPGTDNIRTELFKYGGNELLKHLQSIMMEIWLKKCQQIVI
jgi:hypothetical protein